MNYLGKLIQFFEGDVSAGTEILRLMEIYPELHIPSFRDALDGNGFRIAGWQTGITVDILDPKKAEDFVILAFKISEVTQDTLTRLTAAAVLYVAVNAKRQSQ